MTRHQNRQQTYRRDTIPEVPKNTPSAEDVRLIFKSPAVREFIDLYRTTSWQMPSRKALRKALRGTYCHLCAYDGLRLVATVRILSDGALYAWINDMIVHPEFQHKGIGTRMLRLTLDHLRERGILFVGLFAAPGVRQFYEKIGFQVRPETAPGMYKDLLASVRSL